mmetsp:Transcript_15818/g.30999  ORF Transcript_15818/g.30999 Transcript_15818/m.30999 type:complete len:198 (+) Transcript_15818:83-676(+)
MKNITTLVAFSAMFHPTAVVAFAPPKGELSFRASTICATTRRDFLSFGIATTAAITSGLVINPLPSLADVSDGNSLPQGAAQFSRIIKVRAQLKSVAKRVTEQSDDVTKEEWDKIDDFLRTVYSAGEDMKVISKSSIFDPTKKAKAEEDIKLLQKVVQAGQGPVSKKDSAGFGAVASKADDLFEDFLDLLRDVPDEL